jgi:hypothetical protein
MISSQNDEDMFFTMEQHHFFTFSLITEGTTEKALQFILPLKSIYNKNFGFNEEKCILEHCRKVKKCLKSHCFVFRDVFNLPFQSCPLQPYFEYTEM